MRPSKRSDRVLMVLAMLAAVGVGAALWSVWRSPGGVEWVSNPYRHGAESTPAAPGGAAPAPPAPATPSPADTSMAAEPGASASGEVKRVLTTPQKVVIGQMTAACRQAVKAKGTWKDAARSEPWPECIDAQGRPMVVQFCSYVQLTTGEWLPSANTRNAPRCRAELALVRQGKIPRGLPASR
jgi:hypothetical protein